MPAPFLALSVLSLTICILSFAAPIHARDPRFRSYGAVEIAGYNFPFREGGGSFDACAVADPPSCGADFYTVGQLNDRTIGPYAGLDDGVIFKRFAFLRATRPEHWDCHIGLGLSVTNWFRTQRCIDQLGSDTYREVVQRLLGVKSGEEFKRDVLRKMFDTEKSMLVPFIKHYLDAHGDSATVVLEIGNEPNVHPVIDPATYGWYFKLYSDAARAAAIQVGKERGTKVDLKLMSAGLWIFDGMPSYFIEALSQGIEVSFGRINFPKFTIPTGFKFCGWGPFKYPCGLRTLDIDRTAGVDIKFKVYTDARGYFNAFATAAGPQSVDIAGLHFYPYIARNSAFGEGNMQPHIDALNSLASHAASLVNSHEVWLTEIGNFNPFTIDNTITKVASPLLSALKNQSATPITRWYWFENAGNDKKIAMIPKLDGTTVALAILGIQSLDIALGPLATIEKPKLDKVKTDSIVRLVTDYTTHSPQQGLYNSSEFKNIDHLSPLGTIYHNFATIPGKGAECNGSPGGFEGCRGNGCSVCVEVLVKYPKYFQNRPNCIQNPTCEGQFYQCNAACTEPMGFDK